MTREESSMNRMQVMVVDDEPIVCNRIKSHLEKNGFEVEAYTDSEEALEALERRPYDVVVTDLKMAGPTGLDVLYSVRHRGVPTRVIIITGYATLEAAREAEEVGAFDFVTKPFEAKELTRKVQNAAMQARRGGGLRTRPI